MNTSSKFLVIPAFLGAAVAANAATQTIPFSIAPGDDPVLVFNNFDIASGEVTEISITVSATVTGGSLTIDNDSESAANVDYTFGLELLSLTHSSGGAAQLNGSFNPIIAPTDVSQSGTLFVEANADDPIGDYNNDGGLDNNAVNLGTITNSASGLVSSAGWNAYLGSTGTFSITLSTAALETISNPGAVNKAVVSPTVNGFIEITVVPEPSTYAALFGLAALGLVAVRRRR